MHEIARSTIEEAAEGDIGAFEEIYRAYSPAVYSIAFNITRNSHDAEEAAQDAFVRTFRNLKNFKFESSFGTWLYRVAVNSAINTYNSRARRKQEEAGLDEAACMTDAYDNCMKDEIERQSAKEKVKELLGHLSPDHRSCIVLREIEGLDYGQIADVLRVPINTVRSRLKRAREALVAMGRKEGLDHGL
jgi:RNA polymerase sigma-70 factor (ECF subfamily)